MGHLKAPCVDWLEQARFASDALAEVPLPRMNGLLCGPNEPCVQPELASWVAMSLSAVQDSISLYLTYRVSTRHKVKVMHGGEQIYVSFENASPERMAILYDTLTSAGVKFTQQDRCAFDAHKVLGYILKDYSAWEKSKRELPLLIASIGGPSGTFTASIKAGKKRSKRPMSRLQRAKLRILAANPGITWKEQLVQLSGDRVVTYWDDREIVWKDEDDNVLTTKTSAFRDWKP